MIEPTKKEFDIGSDAYGRTVTLKYRRTYDGIGVWTIHRAEANARDHPESVSGLTTENLRMIGAVVASR